MISYIKGMLEYIGEGFVVVETMGIGYQIFVSPGTVATMPQQGKEVKIHTHMSVKDDGTFLFGFSTREELELFRQLITVSGVGPKGALNILGEISVQDFIMAIISEDVKMLNKLPGVGKKTAQRLLIDLKDKFKAVNFFAEMVDEEISSGTVQEQGAKADAMEALLALGYSRSEVIKGISKIYQEGMDTQTILKTVLKTMVK